MKLKTLFGLWLPLAVSFELMMLEGPAIQGALGRLPEPKLHLAAMGLTLSLSLLIESPVIMLLATAIALVKDGPTFRALRRFMVTLLVFCTAITALTVYTPLYNFIALRLMGQPPAIVAAARPAMQIMLLWTAAIGWRRFYQGVLVKYGQTQKVSWGTAVRLSAAVSTAVLLTRWGHLPGAQVGACALMAAVIVEAAATTLFALPLVRGRITDHVDPTLQPLTQGAIFRFHAPLAATTVLILLAQPITSAALARLPEAKTTLAAWPVIFMLLLILRGWGLALQEITVAYARDPQNRPTLYRFAWIVGSATSISVVVLGCTPLLGLYLRHVLRLPLELHGMVGAGLLVGMLMPLITALGSWARGVLVAGGATPVVYRGMGLNLLTHGTLLIGGVALHVPGVWAASGAFSIAAIVEYVFLARRAAAVFQSAEDAAPVESAALPSNAADAPESLQGEPSRAKDAENHAEKSEKKSNKERTHV